MNFELVNISPRYSVGIRISNNNRDPETALYVMVVFDKIVDTGRVENNPYIGII